MDKLLKFLFIGLGLLCLPAFTPESNQSTLTVEFNNIRNRDGKIFVFIYSYENQYPDNPYLHFEIDKKRVSDLGTLKFIVPNNLDRGQYAVSVLDDENANEDLDMFFGLPTEGYGFSNNVAPFFAMPDYNELLFDLESNKKTINLTLQYIL